MPVRSRIALAGTATLAALLLTSIGCHSRSADHDAFSIGGNSAPPASGFFSPHAQPMPPIEQGQPAVRYAPPSAPAAVPVTLQPVPADRATASAPQVIASSWKPVQHLSTEQPTLAPELNDAVSTPIPRLSPMPVSSGAPMASRMPVGPVPTGDPGNGTVLPQPRLLAESTPPTMVAHGGIMPPMHDNVPREFDKMALPPYVVEPPDMLLIQASDAVTLARLQAIEGQHIVAPDGTVNLGIYGKVRVAGMTLDQVADAVAARLLEVLPGLAATLKKDETGKDLPDQKKLWQQQFSTIELIKKEMQVDVLGYNSKYYYVITDGGGYGQQVYPFLVTGNETVLDAIARVNGLPAVATKKKIWVARATRPGQPPKILQVDWCGVAMRGQSATNYQLFPGDRVFVQSDAWIRTDTWLAKRLSPLLRGFGATLIGASTVNTIKLGSSSGLGLGSALGGGSGVIR